ncbi:MAG: acyl-CoA dehydrogenase [Gammaproteobacteria bacterium]|nr:acyl-CoA dehydrogenase [Gammaproteobacteria bacterium]MDH3371858.1 acyl-CoA dehydrogenase [Gammaproteobacteria bacterium]MDH3407813.1 acyl-CoA dehydrogenase [Gammaproteobacteria bacterium]MDH3551579.1 acyl-CoA dehydrogenase [Gammaproteobacteria bacterium]
MALVLTDDQKMLQDAARDFIADASPVDEFRKLREAGKTRDPELWRQMAELGWSAVNIAEKYEGLQFGLTGLGLIVIEAGRHLVASPLSSTAAIGVSALNLGTSEDARQRLLPEIAAGQTLVAFAVDELNHHDPQYTSTRAKPDGSGGYLLDGRKVFVSGGGHADHYVVLARENGEPDGDFVLALVDAGAKGVDKTKVQLIDSRDYANLDFSEVAVSKDAVLADGSEAGAIVETLIDIAAIVTACELYGCALQSFEDTVRYLTERKQFGRAIGSFQALQHRAAHAFCQLQLLYSVILDALDAAETIRPGLALAASHAKALANDTTDLVTNEAIQMHGGIGVTDELNIGLYLKRARVLRNLFGNTSYHWRRFARLSGY